MKKRFSKLTPILLLAALGCQQEPHGLPAEAVRSLANELYNQQLFEQSIAEYDRYLNNYKLPPEEQANISFNIGNIYFDRVKDYENALAYYIRVKHFHPESDIVDESEKRIIECLERLQRSTDAKQALDEATTLNEDAVRKKRPGEIIAEIGDRQITTGDLDYEMSQLPPFMMSQIKDRSQKVEFLKQMIATDLLYNTAKRKGLDRNEEVIESAFIAKKNVMVQKLLQEELAQSAGYEEEDLEIYYQANIEKYSVSDDSTGVSNPQPFEEVRSQVTQDYIRAKQQRAYERLIDRMMRAENVKVYDDKIQ